MKTKYRSLSWVLVIFFILLGVGSCNSNDDDDEIVVDKPSELTLAETDIRIVVGETTTVDIIEGNGDYTAFSLNENIASVELVGNKLNINALSSGKTAVIVSDKKNNYKSITMVSFYDKIEVEKQNVEIKMRLGNFITKEVAILGGNGGYIVTSDDPNIAEVNIHGDKIIIEGRKEGTVNINIVDQLDVETKISVTIVTTTKAYEGEELEALLNDPTERFSFDGVSSSPYYSSINTVEDDFNVYGWDYWGYSYQKIYFKGDKTVGEKDEAFYTYVDWGTEVYNKQPIEFEIVKNDGTYIWAIFSFIKNEKLIYGHFVKPIS